jgi:hypothetical protein
MTVEALSLWSLGALLGLRHALEPDHLIAVSTLVAGRAGARSALGVGAAWGLGHTLALLAVASALALARRQLSPSLAAGFELGVGVMLIVLGAQSLRRARPGADRGQAGPLARLTAASGPPLSPAAARARPSSAVWRPARRALLVGIVHGLAGSGAITALIAAQFPSLAGRISYVALFGAGSLVGMAGLSGLAGVPLGHAAGRPRLGRVLGVTGGVVAIAIGVVWVVRQGRALLG